ncbi:uncharacterized protein [Neodiprion pinetum]|uniref:uncharacterized protein n=1 Tax=Neodiprion pinetum TaxID=441929 RepID=UPI001EE1423F|nr:uncharacterized protein LOC124211414 isoform X1 [Neodiprion pinetum]
MAPMIAYIMLPAMQLVCNVVIPDIDSRVALGVLKNGNVSIVDCSPIVQHDADPNSNPNESVLPPYIEMPMTTLPDGYESFPEVGAAFKYHSDEAVTWQAATKKCIEEGGSLAAIDSWHKFDILKLLVTPPSHIHVGFTRMYESKDWVDVRTGSPSPTVPWAIDEPWGDYYCVRMHPTTLGLLSDTCSARRHYVCEIEIPRGNN